MPEPIASVLPVPASNSLVEVASLSHRYAETSLLPVPYKMAKRAPLIVSSLLQQPEIMPDSIPTDEATEAADTEPATAPAADARYKHRTVEAHVLRHVPLHIPGHSQ